MPSLRRHVRALALAMLVAAPAIVGAAAVAAPSKDPVFVRGQAAIDRIGSGLPDVARAHGIPVPALRSMLLEDDTLAVDRAGNLAYFDHLAPDEPIDPVDPAPAPTDGPAVAPPVTGPEFQLESLPGASLTIYLDFDGHTTTGTTWNSQYGVTTIESPPFDRDSDPETWSSLELQIIADSWAVVAEDFAPWQVNVTTIDPGADALRYSGVGDTEWGVRVVITDDTFASCGCGGHAYIGAFDDTTDEPAFVYNASFVGVSEAITHEVGHTLFLSHDGTTTGSSYYTGHDGTGPGWAPIMGVGYYEEVSQWSQQEYLNANNTGSTANYGQGVDDIAIISSPTLRNIPLRSDDHGDTTSPTALVGGTPSVPGVIESRSDVDAFSFSTTGGAVALTASPAAVAPNLDIELTLRNALGEVVGSSNPVDAQNASISTSVAAGTYTVAIDGVGVGTPAGSPPSGYTDYGSIGQYTLSGTIAGVTSPDTTPPAAPTGLGGVESDGDVTLGWDANGEVDLAGYVVQRDDGGGFGDIGSSTSTTYVDSDAPEGDIGYRIVAVDTFGNRSTPSDPVVVNVPVTLISHVTSQTTTSGTVAGSYTATHAAGGDAQTITEADATGKPSDRFDRLEHAWQLPAVAGGHTLTIHASSIDGGDADHGVAFQVSSDGLAWEPVVTIAPNGSISASYDIGQRTGTVHVRVIDTDRTRGNRSHDSVTVDFLELTGDGTSVPDPDPTTVLAEVALWQVGNGAGTQRGGVTVTIRDDRGNPVSGATVSIRFEGAFADTASGSTAGDGTVSFMSSSSKRKPVYDVCVVSVTAALPYTPGTEAC